MVKKKKILSKEHKEKIRQSVLKTYQEKNVGKKISKKLKGRKLTDIHKKRIGESNLGYQKMLGKTQSDKTRRKISYGVSQNYAQRRDKTSKYTGVSLVNSNRGKWKALITYRGKRVIIGYFDREIDAVKAYNSAAIMFRGINTKINIINK